MQRVKMMKKYADLIIRNGLNTQARQDVAIIANAEMHTFVGYFVAELYKMHVHSVRVFYRDPVATRFYLMNTPETKLSPIADYITSFYKEASEKNFSIILFEGTDPQVLRKNTREKHQAYRKAIENSCHSSFYKYKRGTLPFVRVAVPTRDWAVSDVLALVSHGKVHMLLDALCFRLLDERHVRLVEQARTHASSR